jgi:hypothetical protein
MNNILSLCSSLPPPAPTIPRHFPLFRSCQIGPGGGGCAAFCNTLGLHVERLLAPCPTPRKRTIAPCLQSATSVRKRNCIIIIIRQQQIFETIPVLSKAMVKNYTQFWRRLWSFIRNVSVNMTTMIWLNNLVFWVPPLHVGRTANQQRDELARVSESTKKKGRGTR